MPRRSVSLLALMALSLAACGGSEPSDPGSQGTLTLALASSATSLNVGGTAAVNFTIVRGGGFTGAVSLAVSGLPAGVTAASVPLSLDANTSAGVLNLTAAVTAAAGAATITITASGTGATAAPATLQLTLVKPSITVAPNPTTISITAGQGGTVTLALTRSAGYTAPITLALVTPPTGVTGTFADSPTTTGSSNLTLAVAGSVAPGAYTVNVKASAPGADDKTTSVALTVVAAGPVAFTIAVDPVEFELPSTRSWTANGIVAIQRTNGFTGPVTVVVQGLSFPVTVGVTPATITAGNNAANLLAITPDNVPPGVYAGTVRVSAAGFATQTAPLRVRISPPSTGSITWNFCNGVRLPRFFAVRDGNGPWKHVVPDGPFGATQATPGKFSFDLTQATGSVAFVTLGEKTSASPLIEGHYWNVFYLTRQEIVDLAAEECITNRDVTARTGSGAVSGYQKFDAIIASVSRLGLASVGSTSVLGTTLSMQNLPTGPFDLMLTRSSFTGPGPDITVQSLVLRRGIDPAAAGTVTPPIDFATEGVAPASAALTFTNANAETVTNTMTFRTADGLNAWMAVAGAFAPTARTWFGVPSSKLLPDDLHQVTATTGNLTARRQIIHFSHEVAARTLAFGDPLSAPVVVPGVGATPWLLRATGALAADYLSRMSIYYRENRADPRTMTIVASGGFIGGAQYDISVPDLAGLPGFTAFWNFRLATPVKWTVTGGQGSTGDLLVDSFCLLNGNCPVKPVNGVTYRSAQATGTTAIP